MCVTVVTFYTQTIRANIAKNNISYPLQVTLNSLSYTYTVCIYIDYNILIVESETIILIAQIWFKHTNFPIKKSESRNLYPELKSK